MQANILAQTTNDKILLINELERLSKLFNIEFNYDNAVVSTIKVSPFLDVKTIYNAIEKLNTTTNLQFTKISDHIIIVEEKSKITPSYSHTIQKLNPISLFGYLNKGINKQESGKITINYSKFSILPGLIEADVLQTIQALPGIQSVDETVSNISIRGGSNDQNLILWDGIKMYQTGHFFGLISSFNPQITQHIHLYKNGTDVSYTDGVSGMIKMQTKTTINDTLKVNLGLNFLNADIFVDSPIGKKSSIQITGRKSLSNFIKTPTYNNYFDRITQNTEVQNNTTQIINSNKLFDFYDTSLRWLYSFSRKDFLRVNFITTQNNLQFNESANINNNLQQKESSLSQQNYGGGIFYKRKWSNRFTTEFNAYESDYLLKSINSDVLNSQQLFQKNSVSETGIRIQANYLWLKKMQLLNGYEIIETEIKNLNDIDIPRFKELNSDVVRTHSLFSQIKYVSKNYPVKLKTGLRLNFLDKFKLFILEPRLALNYKVSSNFNFQLLGELKHQNASQVVNFQNDFLGIEKRRWQLANNDSIPVMKSKQLSLGATYKAYGWLIDLDGYYKNIKGITSQSQSFSTKYEFEKASGSYKVFGLDALIRKQFKLINSWLSYSLMNNNYTFSDFTEITFPSNFDITHTLTFGTTFSNKHIKLSGGINYFLGKPTTLPKTNDEVIANEVNFDNANSSRLKNYFRTDISFLYNFKVAKKWKAVTGVSLWNVTNYQNTLNRYYRIINNTPQEFSQQALGTTANLMLRLYF